MMKTEIVVVDGCDFFDLYNKIKKMVKAEDIISLSHYYPKSSEINCSAVIVLNNETSNSNFKKDLISISSFYEKELMEKIKSQEKVSYLKLFIFRSRI